MEDVNSAPTLQIIWREIPTYVSVAQTFPNPGYEENLHSRSFINGTDTYVL
jgi:hypothetical protein